MKTRIAQALLVAALLAGVAHAAGGGAPQAPGSLRYEVSNLPPLGGTSSVGFSINDRGWVAGRSNLAGNQSRALAGEERPRDRHGHRTVE